MELGLALKNGNLRSLNEGVYRIDHSSDVEGRGTGPVSVPWTIYRRSKQGRVTKTARERYIRGDLGFGRAFGQTELLNERTLSSALKDKFVGQDGRRFLLVLDTNIVLRQMDVLERKDFAVFHNLVVCSTVIDEIKKLNLSVYHRLQLLLRSDERCIIEFPNENHEDTWTPKRVGESSNDYNDRLIYRTAKWFTERIEKAGYASVMLLTNDQACRNAAIKEGVAAKSIQEFVAMISGKFPELEDMIVTAHNDSETQEVEVSIGSKTPWFDQHLPVQKIHEGLKAGKLFQGTFRSSAFGTKEGFVILHRKGEQARKVVIKGMKNVNRAIDGDRIAISLLTTDSLEKDGKVDLMASGGLESQGENEKTVDTLRDDDAERAAILDGDYSSKKEDTKTIYGKVAGILKRNWRYYCGSVDEKFISASIHSEKVLILPVDKKIPKIRIRTKQLDRIKDQRIVVAIDEWDRYSQYPSGHFVRTMGTIGDRATETSVILHEHDIPTHDFSQKVLECLPKEGKSWVVTPENSIGRVDFRSLDVCSIDPPGCKDIDDALHVRVLDTGNIEVGIHIADVTHFVPIGSEIDKEAASRGTSTYLVERRLDMFPGLLTTDICSLVSNVDRFAFSVVCEFSPFVESTDETDDRGLNLLKVSFHKSIIHSKAALSYGEAQAWIEDTKLKGNLPDSVRLLNRIALVLRRRSEQAGSVSFASNEVRFALDDETNDPSSLDTYVQKDANRMVETFMLLANVEAAKRITKAYPSNSLLRRHPKPTAEAFQELIQALRTVKISLNVNSSKELADSLDSVHKPEMPYLNKLVRIMATRCMMQAQYFRSGDVNESDYYHYGLALNIYTHFTSPIRRYPDVVVHRLLAAAEGLEAFPKQYEEGNAIVEIADNCNKRHYNAQLAGYSSRDLFVLAFLRGKCKTVKALVSKVRERGISLVIPEFGIEGKILFANSDSDARARFVYDDQKMVLTENKTGHSIAIFDEVEVNLSIDTKIGYRQVLRIDLVQPLILATDKTSPDDSKETISDSKQRERTKSTIEKGIKPRGKRMKK